HRARRAGLAVPAATSRGLPSAFSVQVLCLGNEGPAQRALRLTHHGGLHEEGRGRDLGTLERLTVCGVGRDPAWVDADVVGDPVEPVAVGILDPVGDRECLRHRLAFGVVARRLGSLEGGYPASRALVSALVVRQDLFAPTLVAVVRYFASDGVAVV